MCTVYMYTRRKRPRHRSSQYRKRRVRKRTRRGRTRRVRRRHRGGVGSWLTRKIPRGSEVGKWFAKREADKAARTTRALEGHRFVEEYSKRLPEVRDAIDKKRMARWAADEKEREAAYDAHVRTDQHNRRRYQQASKPWAATTQGIKLDRNRPTPAVEQEVHRQAMRDEADRLSNPATRDAAGQMMEIN